MTDYADTSTTILESGSGDYILFLSRSRWNSCSRSVGICQIKGYDDLSTGKKSCLHKVKNKSSRLIDRTRMVRTAQGLGGADSSRAPRRQRFSWDSNSSLYSSLRKITAKLIINFYFLPYTNVQHWTQFCCFDVRNINCLKKQYTNKLLEIKKKMQTSLPFFFVYKRPNL